MSEAIGGNLVVAVEVVVLPSVRKETMLYIVLLLATRGIASALFGGDLCTTGSTTRRAKLR
jgi:hypothetical protein